MSASSVLGNRLKAFWLTDYTNTPWGGAPRPSSSIPVPGVQINMSRRTDWWDEDLDAEVDPPDADEPTKNTAADMVRRSLMGVDAYIFGGYVRDSLARKPFGDMDLFFEDNQAWLSFLVSLNREGYYVKLAVREPYARDLGCTQLAYSLMHTSSKQRCFKLDVLIKSEDKGCPFQGYDTWDADINLLTLRPGLGFGRIDTGKGLLHRDVVSLINKASNRQFTALPGMTDKRRAKLLAKGYKEVDPLHLIPEDRMMEASDKPSWPESCRHNNDALHCRACEIERSKGPEMNPSLLGVIKQESPDVAYRAAAIQMTKRIQQAMVALLKKQGYKGAKLKLAQELLEGSVGNIAIGVGLGFGMMYLPGGLKGPKVDRLAKEFRLQGEAQGLSGLMDLGLESILPIIMEGVGKLPALAEEPQVRVMEEKLVDSPPPLLEEDELEIASKSMRQGRAGAL